jgi:signal recognition particle GTPase
MRMSLRVRVDACVGCALTRAIRACAQLVKASKSRAERIAKGAGRSLKDMGDLMNTYGATKHKAVSACLT